MKIIQIFICFFFSSLSFSLSYASDNCSSVIKKIYKQSTHLPTYQELLNALGKPDEGKTIRQIHYEWDNFFLTTRDSRIVQKYGKLPKKLKTDKYRYKNMDIRDVLKIMGEPEKIKKNNLLSLRWQCNNTKSSLSIILTENNKIESYQGQYCRNDTTTLCSKYKREGLILLAE